MVMVMDLGSGKAITRFAGEHRIGELVGGCLLISIVNSVIVTGVAVLLLTSSVPRDGHQSSILPEIILSCIAALSQSLFHNTMSQYRVRNQPFRHLVGSASAGAILYVLSWLLLVILHFGVRSVILSQIVAYSSLAIVAARSLRAGRQRSSRCTRRYAVSWRSSRRRRLFHTRRECGSGTSQAPVRRRIARCGSNR